MDELILVDDESSTRHEGSKYSKEAIDNLGEKLEQFIIHETKKTRLLRLKKRAGLMKARMAGAYVALGDYLVFLDSHIEVWRCWF